ncbi:PPIases accelerate the folding of proteins (By similarity) [Seminavis robusta]|uniref:PPIases accelerate the folding of proteins By similarity n=1 Tax=Seminavis robusta TaxID=568900 RepID=A0A9N8HX00_9STRA|nr:PPIases accelerate the folding of proteins (By similarity) [Seminavis robusta]|eukprot:Sro2862_g338840.1 PPIases accelerate the folding of proteins (By similarity) (395) ;mRNA; r:9202-10386
MAPQDLQGDSGSFSHHRVWFVAIHSLVSMSSIYSTTLHRMAHRVAASSRSRLLLPGLASSSSEWPQQRRWLATPKKKKGKGKRSINGSHGSRGHGWYIKYREGRGGRSLQGEYWDRNQHHWDLQHWNDAVLSLGSQFVYLDIAVEPPTTGGDVVAASPSVAEDSEDISVAVPKEEESEENDATGTSTSAEAPEKDKTSFTVDQPSITTERLIMQVASTVMPETCINFIGLIQEAAYKNTILYRIEREVGICGGDVLTNTGGTGQCWQSFPYDNAVPNTRIRPSPLRRDLPPPADEPLAMWHTAGTVAMLCAKVNEIDSRFILCAHDSPHLDGIHRAFGKLTPESLAVIQEWQTSVLTSYGKPKSATLRIVDCGVLEDYKQEDSAGGSQEEVAAA